MPFNRVLPPLPVALLLQQAEGNQDWKTSSNFSMHTFNCAESSSIQEYSEEIVTQSIATAAGCRAYMSVTTIKCQFWGTGESGTRSAWDNGRTFNCVPFMSWSAPQLSSFLLPSPKMLTSGALLKDDLFPHNLFYVFEVCSLLSQGATGSEEKNESFSRSPKFKYKNNTNGVGRQWPKHTVKRIHLFMQ